ncbi:hypothetical protein U9M48_014228 [Paspalum notatum var. saurae]|uniref:DDE Tnp4 domain-containing protein n=1 Tax=Paspalum notatum var. saurae TaxID=547442 RepID=A0AAQ3WKB5_PASNO
MMKNLRLSNMVSGTLLLAGHHIYTSILSGQKHVEELLHGHKVRVRRELRMEKEIFLKLVELLRDSHLLSNARDITVEEQVAIFLFCLATNASNRLMQERFQHSGETISRYFNIVLQAIISLSSKIIELPPINTPFVISSNPKFMPYFQGCIGAIDGTHIPITMSPSLQDPYRNRKGGLSQNVMVACDFNCQFVHVSAGWEGSAADARVLQDALSHGFYVPHGKYYLVDAGYANTPNFIAPFRNVRYHLQEQGRANQRPSNAKELFNLRHAQLRNHVERIIGVLKMRFSILKCASHYPIDTQTDIVMAGCTLHNFIKKHDGSDQWLNEDGMQWTFQDGDHCYGEDVSSLNERRRAGRNERRNHIAQAMWNDYLAYIQRNN